MTFCSWIVEFRRRNSGVDGRETKIPKKIEWREGQSEKRMGWRAREGRGLEGEKENEWRGGGRQEKLVDMNRR